MSESAITPRGMVTFGHFEEVLSIAGRYLNDHCLILHDGQWHFFGIVGPVGKSCYDEGSEVSFAHATSPDLYHWQVHPDVIQIAGTWPETTHVFAPNVHEYDGQFYMLYTALDDDLKQMICLATSHDLFVWERHAGNPVIVPSLYWAKWSGFGQEKGGACRDPHILRLTDGRFVAYWVAEMQSKFGCNVTCVAASISLDLIHWQEVGPVFTMRAWDMPPTRAVESPCVVFKDQKYWLFFKHGWWTHLAVSDSPLDFHGSEPIRLGYCHASEIFEWNATWWITHCSGDPKDFMYRDSNRKRGLFVGKLTWEADHYPQLI